MQQIAELVEKIQLSNRDILGYARQVGDLLRTVAPDERAALAAKAGITGRRTRFYYVAVAENWDLVSEARSLNEALRIIKRGATRCTGWLPFDKKGCVNVRHYRDQQKARSGRTDEAA